MGTTVNLIEAWEPYKAAKAALANILQTANIKQISQKYLESLKVNLDCILIRSGIIFATFYHNNNVKCPFSFQYFYFRYPILQLQNYKKKEP